MQGQLKGQNALLSHFVLSLGWTGHKETRNTQSAELIHVDKKGYMSTKATLEKAKVRLRAQIKITNMPCDTCFPDHF